MTDELTPLALSYIYDELERQYEYSCNASLIASPSCSRRRTLAAMPAVRKLSQPPWRPPVRSGRRLAFHALFDGAEDAVARLVQRLDAHAIAEAHERRARLAVAQGFHRAQLGEAGSAE